VVKTETHNFHDLQKGYSMNGFSKIGSLVRTAAVGFAIGAFCLTGGALSAKAQSLSTEVAYAAINGQLYRVNLSTGAATLVGNIGSTAPVQSIAIAPTPDTVFGLTSVNTLVSFKALTPGQIETSVSITGLQPGEQIVGMDFRPSVFPTATLYAVGSSNRLYIINTSTGAATQVGSGTFSTPLSGTRFGVNFNPRANANNNLLRIVSDTGQNYRVNPDTGAVAGVDTALNPGTPAVVATAYAESFPGANSTPNPTPPPATNTTTQYDLDAATNSLVTQGGVNGQVGGGPNGGVLTTVGPLGVTINGRASLDISNRFVFPNGIVGRAYNHDIFVFQGTGAYTFAVTAGALPTGLSLSSGGNLTGTPSAAGSFAFDITATGTGGPFTRSYTITVGAATPTNVSDQVTFTTTTQGVTGIAGGCATAGYTNQYNINVDLRNIGTNTLTSPFFQTLELQQTDGTIGANPFRLRTADDFVNATCTGGLVGSAQAIPGPITPAQVIPVNFQIAMPQLRRFRFFVGVYATVNAQQIPSSVEPTEAPVNRKGRAPMTRQIGKLKVEVTSFDKAGNPIVTATFIPEAGSPVNLGVVNAKATLAR
jgi:hypothetical protein